VWFCVVLVLGYMSCGFVVFSYVARVLMRGWEWVAAGRRVAGRPSLYVVCRMIASSTLPPNKHT